VFIFFLLTIYLKTFFLNPEYLKNHPDLKSQCLDYIFLSGEYAAIGTTNFYPETISGRRNTAPLPLSVETQHFKIHYTLTGLHAVASLNYADSVAFYAELAWQQLITQMRFKAPIPDDTTSGGQNLFDIYLQNIPNQAQGQTLADPSLNQGRSTAICYILIQPNLPYINDYQSQGLRAVVQHEFFHAIQNAYYGSALAGQTGDAITTSNSIAVREGTATWAQTLITNPIVNYSHLACFMANDAHWQQPNQNIWAGQNDSYLYEQASYATVFFWQFLTEHYGSDIIRLFWEKLAKSSLPDPSQSMAGWEFTALDSVLQPYGGINTAVGQYWCALTLLQLRPNYEVVRQTEPALTFKDGNKYVLYMPNITTASPVLLAQSTTTTNKNENPLLYAIGGAALHEIKGWQAQEKQTLFNLEIPTPNHNLLPSGLQVYFIQYNKRTESLKICSVQIKEAIQNQPNLFSFFLPDCAHTSFLSPNDASLAQSQFDKNYLLLVRTANPDTALQLGNYALQYMLYTTVTN
jgi:hypothetical protein